MFYSSLSKSNKYMWDNVLFCIQNASFFLKVFPTQNPNPNQILTQTWIGLPSTKAGVVDETINPVIIEPVFCCLNMEAIPYLNNNLQ